MIQLIFEWIYENAMAIFISSFISFLSFQKYYDKANRENVLMTVIFRLFKYWTVKITQKEITKNFMKSSPTMQFAIFIKMNAIN